MNSNSSTGAAFITTGTLTGAGISSAVGGIGLAGSFGAVGIGTTTFMAAGSLAGAAVYGAVKGITEGDAASVVAIAVGAFGGVGCASFVGSIGFVAPKVGLAFGIGTVPMAGIGAMVGLAAYGISKLLDESQFMETPMQVFERMEAKVLDREYYSAALMELLDEDIEQKFVALAVEEELENLKAKLNIDAVAQVLTNPVKVKSSPSIQTETLSLTNQISRRWQCIKTIKAHRGQVNALAIHPNGKTFISGSDDREVRLWDITNGKWLYTFSGQAAAVLAVAISPDGKQIISGSVDRTISSWQLESKQFHRTFFYLNSPYSHNSFVNGLAYSDDGKIIASASTDHTIRLWKSQTGQVKQNLTGHSEAVLAVVISPDGRVLASAGQDKTVRVWNLPTGKQQWIFTEHTDTVHALAITSNGQTLISGSADTNIKVWNLTTGKLDQTLIGHSAAVLSVAIHPNGEMLASASQDGVIKVWNLYRGEVMETLTGFSPLAFSPDGKVLICSGVSGTIKIWRALQQDGLPLTGEWWEILGVEPNATFEDVKQAYRRLARLYHPDINNSANAKAVIQAVNHAYQVFQEQFKSS
ncbi:WD-40 repeat protein [Richelia sinica FACHB-800]|uniref:WD-40 repeat protein n=1 Tax=Richelia sinica FACHB-800 TaxID=1357546 RepID=A0A975T9R3_9NOST|nr:DnaJ domain-containing protein [Richelia sinica]MBD2665925.1 DnaJ domain-containing protein [Richelia sinica FACHB-800]QXE23966.1 WD-40 repeat protein [Richelia sinica FACHB-800]